MHGFLVINQTLWTPKNEKITNIYQFACTVSKEEGRDLTDWARLYDWSIHDPKSFWFHASEYFGLVWQKRPKTVVSVSPDSPMTGTRFFPDGSLNFAENLIAKANPQLALVNYYESGETLRNRQQDITRHVAILQRKLKDLGVRKGDRVGGVLANGFHAVTAMLATTSLGAIWSSCSPDFGLHGILERFGQISPKVIFFTPRYVYANKEIDCTGTATKLREALSCQLISCPHLNNSTETGPWEQYTEIINSNKEAQPTPSYEECNFNDPAFILYSSGTTGKPKCIIHGIGGTLLQHFKELGLHCNLSSKDKLFYFTTCGWMMWNWMISSLGLGATVVTYDGSVSSPDKNTLWQIIANEDVSVFGTSPKYLSYCEKNNVDVSSGANLRMILSTGSPLLPDQYNYIYQKVNPNLHLASISGGTDIVSCFMLGNPLLPVKSGKIQSAGLGMAVEAWNDNGEKVLNQKAELVCVKPFVSMPVGFWNDPNQEKFKKSYFEYFSFTGQEVWRHGDYISIDEEGSITVFGRSDTTLNPGGVRIGTAEIYEVVESVEGVVDSVAIGLEKSGDVEIHLFVITKPDQIWSKEFVDALKQIIRSDLTPRHVPKDIHKVTQIPYTRSGKKVELALKRALAGEKELETSSLVNPESLEQYYKIGYELKPLRRKPTDFK